MAVSDAAACIFGVRYGRRAYSIFKARITYVGSVVFFSTTLILTIVTLVLDGTAPLTLIPTVLSLAAGLTLVEATFGGGSDNAVLPVAAATLLTLVT